MFFKTEIRKAAEVKYLKQERNFYRGSVHLLFGLEQLNRTVFRFNKHLCCQFKFLIYLKLVIYLLSLVKCYKPPTINSISSDQT